MTNRQLDGLAFFGMIVVSVPIFVVSYMIATGCFPQDDCDIKYIGTRFYSFSHQLTAQPKTFRANGKKWVVMSKDYYDSHMNEAE